MVISGQTGPNNLQDIYVELPGDGLGIISQSVLTPDLAAVITPQVPPVQLDSSISGVLKIFSSSTVPTNPIYITLPGSGNGLGIVGYTSSTPDLKAVVYGTNLEGLLLAAINGESAELPVFSGESYLYSYIVPVNSGESSLSGIFYRAAYSGIPYDLESFILPVTSGELEVYGFVRGFQTWSGTLSGFIEAVPPVPLYAEISPQSVLTLSGSLSGIEPVDLEASIFGKGYKPLEAEIQGYDQLDIYTSVTGISFSDLTTSISGYITDESILHAEINTDDLYRLFCSISGRVSQSGDLLANLDPVLPEEIIGSYIPIPPVDLYASVSGLSSPHILPATITGVYPPEHLTGQIIPVGGYVNFFSSIHGLKPGIGDGLSASIDGAEKGDLRATINIDSQSLLQASITASGPYGNIYLLGQINGVDSSSINASITILDPPKIVASYSPVLGATLGATIYPDIFYIDALIPINTYAINDLRAVINTITCDFRTDVITFGAYIKAVQKGDLQAQIIGAHQLVRTVDLLPISLNRQHLNTDYFNLVLDPTTLTTDYLPLIILNSPFGDLSASIVGIRESADLKANIKGLTYGSFITSDPSTGVWVNPYTGQRKIIRFLFTLTGKVYYYSEVADKTFPEYIKDTIKVIVETYDPIIRDPADGITVLAQKRNVRRCIVSDLTPFSTWDDAVKYGIICAAGLFTDLSASITPKNTKLDLYSSYIPISSDEFSDLPSKIVSVTNQPTILATIAPQGGYGDLWPYTRGITPGHTTPPTTISGELLPLSQSVAVTYSGADPQIVLQDMLKSDSLVIPSLTPDLWASILGIDELTISATITGSI